MGGREPARPADWQLATAIAVGAAIVLAALCAQVSDWAVMTDELLYERLAISFAEGSVVPTLHGERVDVFAVLYPFLLAPVFAIVDLPDAIRVVHGVNGVLFASASVPAFLLARELALTRLVAAATALFTVAVPWTVIGGFVMTEAAAYPAALWALLAIQRAVVLPSPRRDLVALAAILVATLARPQLAALGLVLVLAAVAQEARFGRWREHAVAFGVAALGLAVVALGGSGLLGSYAPALEEGALVSVDALRSALLHVNVTAVALGIVPLIVGLGWSVGALVRPPTPERSAFAAVGVAALVVLAVESGSVVERFGLGLEIKDRYVFYVAPLLCLATACALDDPRPRLAGLLAVGALFVLTVGIEEFEPVFGVNIDSPASSTHEALTRFGNNVGMAPGELLAVAGGLLVVALFFAFRRAPRGPLAAVVLAGTIAFVAAESAYTWDRLYASSGPSGRALTGAQPPDLSWIDRAAPSGSVGMLAFSVGQDWYPSAGAWWDVEFWNARVDRAYMIDGYFTYTPDTFPRPRLRVDPRTGRITGTDELDYIVRAPLDSRFGPAGIPVASANDLELVDLELPLRAAWMTIGVDPDGWTRVRPALLRVFPPAGATLVRAWLSAPDVATPRAASIGTAGTTLGPTEERQVELEVCVPAGGYADVPIRANGTTSVRAIATNPPYADRFREVGIRVSRIEALPSGRPC